MGLDAASVLKWSVLCQHCNEEYYFTLRAISDNPELRCHGCGGSICLGDSVYKPLINDVRIILKAIHSAQSAASFISAHPAVAV
jgi:predicted nucleic acid-binding Zn ribbon protein